MATGRREERRILDRSELELVERTHHPRLAEEADSDLTQLLALIRERRDRARSIASRRRGAARRGQGPDKGEDVGMNQKAGLLAEALVRVNKERTRREAKTKKSRQSDFARRALELRRENGARTNRPDPGRTADTGLNPVENERAPTIGSAMEAGRVSQFVRNAQAARDNRD